MGCFPGCLSAFYDQSDEQRLTCQLFNCLISFLQLYSAYTDEVDKRSSNKNEKLKTIKRNLDRTFNECIQLNKLDEQSEYICKTLNRYYLEIKQIQTNNRKRKSKKKYCIVQLEKSIEIILCLCESEIINAHNEEISIPLIEECNKIQKELNKIKNIIIQIPIINETIKTKKQILIGKINNDSKNIENIIYIHFIDLKTKFQDLVQNSTIVNSETSNKVRDVINKILKDLTNISNSNYIEEKKNLVKEINQFQRDFLLDLNSLPYIEGCEKRVNSIKQKVLLSKQSYDQYISDLDKIEQSVKKHIIKNKTLKERQSKCINSIVETKQVLIKISNESNQKEERLLPFENEFNNFMNNDNDEQKSTDEYFTPLSSFVDRSNEIPVYDIIQPELCTNIVTYKDNIQNDLNNLELITHTDNKMSWEGQEMKINKKTSQENLNITKEIHSFVGCSQKISTVNKNTEENKNQCLQNSNQQYGSLSNLIVPSTTKIDIDDYKNDNLNNQQLNEVIQRAQSLKQQFEMNANQFETTHRSEDQDKILKEKFDIFNKDLIKMNQEIKNTDINAKAFTHFQKNILDFLNKVDKDIIVTDNDMDTKKHNLIKEVNLIKDYLTDKQALYMYSQKLLEIALSLQNVKNIEQVNKIEEKLEKRVLQIKDLKNEQICEEKKDILQKTELIKQKIEKIVSQFENEKSILKEKLDKFNKEMNEIEQEIKNINDIHPITFTYFDEKIADFLIKVNKIIISPDDYITITEKNYMIQKTNLIRDYLNEKQTLNLYSQILSKIRISLQHIKNMQHISKIDEDIQLCIFQIKDLNIQHLYAEKLKLLQNAQSLRSQIKGKVDDFKILKNQQLLEEQEEILLRAQQNEIKINEYKTAKRNEDKEILDIFDKDLHKMQQDIKNTNIISNEFIHFEEKIVDFLIKIDKTIIRPDDQKFIKKIDLIKETHLLWEYLREKQTLYLYSQKLSKISYSLQYVEDMQHISKIDEDLQMYIFQVRDLNNQHLYAEKVEMLQNAKSLRKQIKSLVNNFNNKQQDENPFQK